MKKYLVIFCILASASVYSQTEGTLAVSVTTKGTGITGKNYNPRNCFAIWIQDEKGDFIKTLYVNAMARRTHLNAFEAVTTKAGVAFNNVDAISGATANTHGTRTCSWDGTNFKGEKVPDGKYFVFMELTDVDASGKVASFPFNKGNQKNAINPPDNTSFTAVAINWIPVQ